MCQLHVYNETPNLVNFVLMSLTYLYLQQIIQVSCWELTCYGMFLWSLFLVTNIEWKKPAALATCNDIDLSWYVSGPIRRYLFIDDIIMTYIPRGLVTGGSVFLYYFSHLYVDPCDRLQLSQQQVSMIRIYPIHVLQTNPWHREEEP